MITYVHTNIIAHNWKTLSQFYIDALECTPVYPERNMQGEWIEKITNIPGVHIEGIHLKLPGMTNGQTLEIFTYNHHLKRQRIAQINETGFAHVAFRVDSVQKYVDRILEHGGTFYGEIADTDIEDVGHLTVVYMRDPEGNIVEIQKWD